MADEPNLDLNTVIPLLQGKQNMQRADAVQDEQQGLAAKSAAEVAAARTKRAAQPPGGRQDSGAADALARMLVPGVGPAMDLAGGNYGQAATGAALSAMPYGGRFIPNILKKIGLGAGAATLGMSPTGAGEAEAAGKPQPPPPPAPNVAPQTDEDKEIAQLQADQAKAVEVGRHSKNPGDMAKAQAEFDQRIQDVRDRYRGKREFSQWQEGIKQDPSFQGLPESMQNDVLRAKTMDEGNAALSEAKRKTTPFAQQNPDLVRNLELGGAGLTLAVPGLHNAYDRAALANATRRATKLAGQPSGDIAAGRLKALTNSKPNEVARLAGHWLGGATAPYFAGTVAPSLIDTFTLPHDSASYQQSAAKLDPTNPAFWPPIQRSLIESGIGTGAGTYLGHALTRPDTARTLAKGTLNALDQRAAAKAAAEAPKMAEPTPPPESRWTTPKFQTLGGVAAEGRRRTVENQPGWKTVIEGKEPSPDEVVKQLKKPKGKKQ